MLGRSHVVIAWATWAAVAWRPVDLGPGLAAPLVGAGQPAPPGDLTGIVATAAMVGVGALLPDLDHTRALVARWRVGWIRPFAIPAHVMHAEFGHRGGLHSLAAAALVLLGTEFLTRQVGLAGVGGALAWGYVAHLLADMLTRQGVPLLWPVSRVKVGAPLPLAVRTGGLGETLYLALVAALAGVYAVGRPGG